MQAQRTAAEMHPSLKFNMFASPHEMSSVRDVNGEDISNKNETL
jgi:hypothetical protein